MTLKMRAAFPVRLTRRDRLARVEVRVEGLSDAPEWVGLTVQRQRQPNMNTDKILLHYVRVNKYYY